MMHNISNSESLQQKLSNRLAQDGDKFHLDLTYFLQHPFHDRRARLDALAKFVNKNSQRITSIDCSECDFTVPEAVARLDIPFREDRLMSIVALKEMSEEARRRRGIIQQQIEQNALLTPFSHCLDQLSNLEKLTFTNNWCNDNFEATDFISKLANYPRNLKSITLSRLPINQESEDNLRKLVRDHSVSITVLDQCELQNQLREQYETKKIREELNRKADARRADQLLTPERLEQETLQAVKDNNAPWLALLMYTDLHKRLSKYLEIVELEGEVEDAIVDEQKCCLKQQKEYLKQQKEYLKQQEKNAKAGEDYPLNVRQVIHDRLTKFQEMYQLKLEKALRRVYQKEGKPWPGISSLQEYISPLPAIPEVSCLDKKVISDFTSLLGMFDCSNSSENKVRAYKYNLLKEKYKYSLEKVETFVDQFEIHWKEALKTGHIPPDYRAGGALFRERFKEHTSFAFSESHMNELLYWAYDRAQEVEKTKQTYSKPSTSKENTNDEIELSDLNKDSANCLSIMLDQPGVSPLAFIALDEGQGENKASVFEAILGETDHMICSQQVTKYLYDSFQDLRIALPEEGQRSLSEMQSALTDYLENRLMYRNAYPPFIRRVLGISTHFSERKQEYHAHLESIDTASRDLDRVKDCLKEIVTRAKDAKRGLFGRSRLNDPLERGANGILQSIKDQPEKLEQHRGFQKTERQYLERARNAPVLIAAALAAVEEEPMDPETSFQMTYEGQIIQERDQALQKLAVEEARKDQAKQKDEELKQREERVRQQEVELKQKLVVFEPTERKLKRCLDFHHDIVPAYQKVTVSQEASLKNLATRVEENLNKVGEIAQDYMVCIPCTPFPQASSQSQSPSLLIVLTQACEKENNTIHSLVVTKQPLNSMMEESLQAQIKEGCLKYYDRATIHTHKLPLQEGISEYISEEIHLLAATEWLISHGEDIIESLKNYNGWGRGWTEWRDLKRECKKFVTTRLIDCLDETVEHQQQILNESERYIEQMELNRCIELEELLTQPAEQFALTRSQNVLRAIEESGQYSARHLGTRRGRAHRIGISDEDNQANLYRLQEVRVQKLKEAEEIATEESAWQSQPTTSQENPAYIITSLMRESSNASILETQKREYRQEAGDAERLPFQAEQEANRAAEKQPTFAAAALPILAAAVLPELRPTTRFAFTEQAEVEHGGGLHWDNGGGEAGRPTLTRRHSVDSVASMHSIASVNTLEVRLFRSRAPDVPITPAATPQTVRRNPDRS